MFAYMTDNMNQSDFWLQEPLEITISCVVSQNVKNRLSILLCSQGVIFFSEILEHFSSILVKKRGVVGKMYL